MLWRTVFSKYRRYVGVIRSSWFTKSTTRGAMIGRLISSRAKVAYSNLNRRPRTCGGGVRSIASCSNRLNCPVDIPLSLACFT